MLGTVRLNDFANILNTTRDIIVNAQKQDREPWDASEFPQGQHRRFDGSHALAWVLLEMLNAQGVDMATSAQAVFSQRGSLGRFMDALDQSQPQPPFFVASISVAEEEHRNGELWVSRWLPTFAGVILTADDLSQFVAEEIAKTGRVTEFPEKHRTVRRIGGPRVAIASITEAYRLLRQRAELAGFVIDGRKIHRIIAQIEGDE